MRYFTNTPYTQEALKGEYRVLCKRLHPDTGGSADAFKEMMQEYRAVRLSVSAGTQRRSCREANEASRQQPNEAYRASWQKTEKGSTRTEDSRYELLRDLLAGDIGFRDVVMFINDCLQLFRKLARLPFTAARVRYYGYYRLLKVEMEFDGEIEELKVEKFMGGHAELSYTIYGHDMMYMSTATVDVIIDKILKNKWRPET